MKKFLLAACFFTLSIAVAESAKNPGEDPNLNVAKGSSTEAGVAAIGCHECIQRMVHTRLTDDTTFRKGGTAPGNDSKSEQGTK